MVTAEELTPLPHEGPVRFAAGWPLGALVAALAVGMMLSALIPPFQSPDEFDHVKRAAALFSGQILVTTPQPGGTPGLWVDDGLLFYMQVYDRLPFKTGTRVNMSMVDDGNQALWRGTKSFSPAPGVGYYFPMIYLPQAVGLHTGRMLGWTVANSYRLARLMVLLSSLAILYAAFTLFPTNFFTLGLLLLPTTLFQMSSASLDAVTMALTILCCSLFMRGADPRATFPTWMAVVLSAAVVLLSTCRVNMVVLTVMPLFLYFVRRERLYLYLSIAAVLLVGAWAVAAFSTTQTTKNGVPQPVFQITWHYLLHPWQFVTVLRATFSAGPIVQVYMQQFVGTLGWLEPRLPTWFYATVIAVLTSVLLLSISRSTPGSSTHARWFLTCLSLGSLVLLFGLLLVTWTPHPATVVMGVQGRYFLLPLLVFSYALHGDSAPLRTRRAYIAYPALGISGLLALYVMTDALLQKYYVSPAMWIQ